METFQRYGPGYTRGIRRKSSSCLAVLPLPTRKVSKGYHSNTLHNVQASTDTTHVRALQASPNAAHYALAQLSLPSVRTQLAPNSNFTLVTQNVDGLSTRALTSVLASASAEDRNSSTVEHPHILEMHGRLFDVKCWSEDCDHTEWNDQSPVCEALRGTETLVDAGVVEPVVEESHLPHCSKCGELARPGVVWFGEIPVHLDLIDKLVSDADLCLVVGTSSTVC